MAYPIENKESNWQTIEFGSKDLAQFAGKWVAYRIDKWVKSVGLFPGDVCYGYISDNYCYWEDDRQVGHELYPLSISTVIPRPLRLVRTATFDKIEVRLLTSEELSGISSLTEEGRVRIDFA